MLTKRWISRQVAPTWKVLQQIDSTNGTTYLKDILDHAKLTERHRKLIDTLNGAESSALTYSIIETAKANNLNPFRYLEYLLTEMMEHEEETDYGLIDKLLPWSDKLPEICKIKTKNES